MKRKMNNRTERRLPAGAIVLALLLAGALFAFGLMPAVAQAQGEGTAQTTARLNFREGPGTDAAIISTLPVGAEVTFTGLRDATGDWAQVRAADGTVGWVYASFLSGVPENLEPAPEGEGTLTPSVTTADQAIGADEAVLVPQVVADQAGWLVIHRQEDGAPGAVIGHAAVDAGVNNDVVVNIDTSQATAVLYAMLHVDEGQMGVYEFPGADGPVTVNGNVVVEPFSVTDIAAFTGEFFPSDVVTAQTTTNLNLRTGPGLDFDILETLPQGAVVGFTGFMDATGNWVQVDPISGPVGWVAAQFLTSVPDGLNVLQSQVGELTPSISVQDQVIGDDSTVTVSRVVAAQPGWVVIHRQEDGAPGTVIGHAQVDAGISENVSVPISADMVTGTLYAMLHVDEGQAGVYEFPGPDAPAMVNGNVVVQPFMTQPQEVEDEFAPDVVTAQTTVNLNLREGPGLDYNIVDTLPRGTVVGFTGFADASGNWVQVDPVGAPVGWVSVQFLSNVPGGLQVPETMP